MLRDRHGARSFMYHERGAHFTCPPHYPQVYMRVGAVNAPLHCSVLTIEQATGVAKDFIRAYMAIAMFSHEAVNHFIDLTQLILVGRSCRSSDLHDIAQVGKQFLFNGLFQTLVTGIIEGHAFTSQGRDANEYFLAEGTLGIVSDAYLLFDGTHQLLVRLHLFIGTRVATLRLIAIRFDIVEVIVQ